MRGNRTACLHFGAEMGKGVGMLGQSYAIPTMQGGVETIHFSLNYPLSIVNYQFKDLVCAEPVSHVASFEQCIGEGFLGLV